ncbi:COMM domain-containing protein 10 isoform X2 [Dendrobates tinctorius]|uniref:COMM domain-containing protein 10 isoform X2 n=1 Tax=Dendrobates tinctorius TaxID=92724 RepID=UPI003CCA26F1
MATAVFRETVSIRQAVSILNGMDAGRFPRLLSRIVQKLHLKAVYHNLKTPVFRQQLENIHLDQSKIEAFASVWENVGPETVERFRQRTFTPKKLETTAWQLNLQMAQSTQARMKSPQAVLELGVSTEDTKLLQQPNSNYLYFQQDGALPHYSRVVHEYLDETFPNKWIGRRGPLDWPGCSPDLIPMDFFFWGVLKDKVYSRKPKSVSDLKNYIRDVFQEINT